ncbi:MAG: hypothetical protein LUI39_09240 [Lachnospiraceae bacterium]|nr:hypothetical protein [Lachnospiraceae bacterium]
MSRSQKHAGTDVKEADIRKAESFGSITALIVIVLCVLFVSGLLQNFWVLNFIQMFGALMNLSLLLISVLRKKPAPGVLALLLLIVQGAALAFFLI